MSSLDGFSIREILATIWRRKLIVISTIVILTLLTAVILQLLTPVYMGKAKLMIENRDQNITNLSSILRGFSADAETIESEIQVISSRNLAQKVITELGLKENPEFNQTPAEIQTQSQNFAADIFATTYKAVSNFFAKLKPDNNADSKRFGDYSEKEYALELERSKLVNYFLDNLEVKQISASHVVAIEFKAKSPVLAASIVNKLIDLYLQQQLDEKFEATQRATRWLNQKVAEIQQTVEASDTAVELFRRNSGLLQGKEGNLTAQQISQINSQLMLAKANLTEARVRLRQIRKYAGSRSRSAIESASEVLQSITIQRLRAQEADLHRSIAELSTEYGKRHPKMINLSASLADLQRKIRAEEQKIVKRLENEVAIAKSRVWSLQNSLNELKGQVADANEDEISLKALEREAEANRMLLNNFLSRFKEISSQEDTEVHQPDATIVSRADLPVQPSFPKKIPILMLSIVASSFIGLLMVFLIEHLEAGFRSGEQIEEKIGINSLGFIPLLKGFAKHKLTSSSFFVNNPRSAYSQAFNSLIWNIQLGNEHAPVKTILITSTEPQEGKTTVAVSLAKKYALNGKKTIIIDADCYLPSVRKHFKMKNSRGLLDVLQEKHTLEEAIRNDDKTGIDTLLNGRPEPSPTNILASDRFDSLIETLSEKYDIIIVDTCPVLAASDALILSRKLDTTIFVVRWASTSQKAVNLAIKKLLKNDCHLTGAILTMVDAQKYSLYDYGDSGAYAGQLKNYYGK